LINMTNERLVIRNGDHQSGLCAAVGKSEPKEAVAAPTSGGGRGGKKAKEQQQQGRNKPNFEPTRRSLATIRKFSNLEVTA
jgi:hypothetical protein